MVSARNNLPRKNYYRVDEVAGYFSISPRTIYRLIEEGSLPALRLRGSLRIKASDLKKLERSVRITKDSAYGI